MTQGIFLVTVAVVTQLYATFGYTKDRKHNEIISAIFLAAGMICFAIAGVK